jgi:Sedlin, N-terminal conserved region
VMRRVHDLYVGVVFNPFYVPDEREKIVSIKFEREIDRLGREWKATI